MERKLNLPKTSSYFLSENHIKAIHEALAKGCKIELTPQKDGSVKVRTVWRKELKV